MSVESWELRKEGAWMGVCINLVPQNPLTYWFQTFYWKWKQRKITRALATTFVNEKTIELGENTDPYKEKKQLTEQSRRKILLSKQQRLERRIILCTLKKNQEHYELASWGGRQEDGGSERQQHASKEMVNGEEPGQQHCELSWIVLNQSLKKPVTANGKNGQEKECEQGEGSEYIVSSGSITLNIPDDNWKSDWDEDEDDVWSNYGDYNASESSSVMCWDMQTQVTIPQIDDGEDNTEVKENGQRNTTTVECKSRNSTENQDNCQEKISALDSRRNKKKVHSPQVTLEESETSCGEEQIFLQESLELHLRTWLGHKKLRKLVHSISMTYGMEIAIDTRCFIGDKVQKLEKLQQKRRILLEKIERRKKVINEREGKPWYTRMNLTMGMPVCYENNLSVFP